MKAMRKIVPALAMLLVSIVVMSSASFAWFTMSRQVTAQGMNVTVTAPNNLMIKLTGADDNTYAEIATKNNVAAVELQPASSNSGANNDIYVVKNGQPLYASGTKEGMLYTQAENGKDTILEIAKESTDPTLGTTIAGYVDFKYTLKTDSTNNVNIVVRSITVSDHGSNSLSLKPVRVAVIGTETKIFKPVVGAANFDDKVVETISETGVATLASDATIYTACAENSGDSNIITTLTSGTTRDIIIRVWYEGQDKDCKVSTAAGCNFDIEVVLADVANLPAP